MRVVMNSKLLIFGLLLASSFNLAAMNDDESASFEMFGDAGKHDDKVVSKHVKRELRLQLRALKLITDIAESYENTVVKAAEAVATPEMRAEYDDKVQQVEYVLESVVSEAEELVEQLKDLLREIEDRAFVAKIKKLHALAQDCFYEKGAREPNFLIYCKKYCVGGAVKSVRTLGTQMKLGVEALRKMIQ